jgi:UDP-N-acetylglucosamine 3-dehydrogenase
MPETNEEEEVSAHLNRAFKTSKLFESGRLLQNDTGREHRPHIRFFGRHIVNTSAGEGSISAPCRLRLAQAPPRTHEKIILKRRKNFVNLTRKLPYIQYGADMKSLRKGKEAKHMAVKIGIIGCGAITRRAFLPGFAQPGSAEAKKANPYYDHGGCKNAEVVALSDVDVEKAKDLAAEFHVPRTYDDWHDLLADKQIDAVCINTPNHLHAEMTVEAAKAKKHVMVEKPMAGTIEEADMMVDAARQNGVFLMVDQTQRFWPMHEVAVDIVRSGLIGRVISVRGKMAHGGPQFWSPTSTWFRKKREGIHGAMFDIGIHKLDLIRYILDSPISEVAAFTSTFSEGIDVEDNAVAIFRTKNGVTGVLEASWTCNPRENTTYVYGELGNLKLGHTKEEPIFVEIAVPDAAQNRDIPPGTVTSGKYVPVIPTRSKFGGPWQHFVDSITSGTQPFPSGEEGRASLEVILAAFRSSSERRTVSLPLSRKG